MKSLAPLFRSSSCPRALAFALIGLGVAGCSADTTRFGEAGARGGDVTGSIASGTTAPVGHVDTQPLPQTSSSPPPQVPARTAQASPPPVAYSSPQYTPATYNPPPAEATTPVRRPTSSGQWSWDGGVAITVAQGETVEGIAHRHSVPVEIIMQANNLASPNAIQPGQRLVIPRYNPPLTPPPAQAAKPATVVATTAAHAAPAAQTASPAGDVHVVAPGDTLSKIARTYGKSVHEIAKANNIQPDARLSVGDRIVIPGVRIGSAKTEAEPVLANASKPANAKVAATTPASSAGASAQPGESPVTETVAKATTDATPGFRWPARGRIIAGFGPKANGQQNDGIDVAVPENTPIKAAEDGVVAYAGNELKGYGNLVLVKHPNGYVTAYAHAKELLVKRGDQIKRGEVIAKSGQTGNVDVPELHFEVRKGSAPVDPMQFLNGA
jgi:murein DD-endopeptidase MepM/ murein hydrolase activator NlpD